MELDAAAEVVDMMDSADLQTPDRQKLDAQKRELQKYGICAFMYEHTSWFEHHLEEICYKGDSLFEVRSTMTLNYPTLKTYWEWQNDSCEAAGDSGCGHDEPFESISEVENDRMCPILLPVTEKRSCPTNMRVEDGAGRRLAPLPEDAAAEVQRGIFFSILDKREYELFDGDVSGLYLLEEPIQDMIFECIRHPLPSQDSIACNFVDKVAVAAGRETDASYKREWAAFLEKRDYFLPMLSYFSSFKFAVLEINLESDAYKTIVVSRTEPRLISEKLPPRRNISTMLDGHKLHIPLWNIGFSENETYVIEAPEGTRFIREGKHSDPFEILLPIPDGRGEHYEPGLEAWGYMTGRQCRFKARMAWNSEENEPVRRNDAIGFAGQPFIAPRIAPEPGRLRDAWLAFAVISAVFFLLDLVLAFKSVSLCGLPEEFEILSVLIMLFAFSLSNLYERVRFVPRYLMKPIRYWVHITAGADAICFAVPYVVRKLFCSSCFCGMWPSIVILAFYLAGFAVSVCFLVQLRRWYRKVPTSVTLYHGDLDCSRIGVRFAKTE